MGQITATRNLVATKVVRHAGQRRGCISCCYPHQIGRRIASNCFCYVEKQIPVVTAFLNRNIIVFIFFINSLYILLMSDGMTRNLPHITAPPLKLTWFHTVKQTSGHVELCWCIMIITVCIDSCLNRIYVLCNYFFSPSPVVPVPFLCAQGLGSSRWWLVSLESLGHLQPWLRHRRPLPDTTMWWSRVGKKKS